MTGEHQIRAPREVVWAALNDAEILKQSIPGCQTLTKTSDTELVAQVVAKVGPVQAKFNGKVTLSDLDPPNGYTISGEGQGGAAGFAKGGARILLAEADGGTLLKFEAHAQIGGKLAQIGSRLVDGAARKMGDDFFTAFSATVEARNSAAAAADPGSASSATLAGSGVKTAPHIAPEMPYVPMPSRDREPTAKDFSAIAWISGLVAVVGAGLWWFLR